MVGKTAENSGLVSGFHGMFHAFCLGQEKRPHLLISQEKRQDDTSNAAPVAWTPLECQCYIKLYIIQQTERGAVHGHEGCLEHPLTLCDSWILIVP